MWKNSLKNVESDNNKILYETLSIFLQRNGTYCLNKHRISDGNIVFDLRFFLKASNQSLKQGLRVIRRIVFSIFLISTLKQLRVSAGFQ